VTRELVETEARRILFLGGLYGFIRPVNTFFALASVGHLDKATSSIVGVGRRSHLPLDSATGQSRPGGAPTGA
jgi:hypothetical protein